MKTLPFQNHIAYYSEPHSTGSVHPGDLFQAAFGLEGVVPNNEAITSLALSEYAVRTASIFALGMCCNIVLARFSKLKYIFLTGHHALYRNLTLHIRSIIYDS